MAVVKTELDLVNFLHQEKIYPIARREKVAEVANQMQLLYHFLQYNAAGETVELTAEQACALVGEDINSTEGKNIRNALNYFVEKRLLDSKRDGGMLKYSNNISRVENPTPVDLVLTRSSSKEFRLGSYTYLQSPRDADTELQDGLGRLYKQELVQPLEGRKLVLVGVKDGRLHTFYGSTKGDSALYRAWLWLKDVYIINRFEIFRNGMFWKTLDIDYSKEPDAKRAWDKKYDKSRPAVEWLRIDELFFKSTDTYAQVRCIKEVDPSSPGYKPADKAEMTAKQVPVVVKAVEAEAVPVNEKEAPVKVDSVQEKEEPVKEEPIKEEENPIKEEEIMEKNNNGSKIQSVNAYINCSMPARHKLQAIKAMYYEESDSPSDLALVDSIKAITHLAIPSEAKEMAIKALIATVK